MDHKVKTQCKNLYIVLSRIYALSSENFLGLNLGLCKTNTNIRYGWTFNVSNLIVDLIAMFCPEIWTFWGLTHIQFWQGLIPQLYFFPEKNSAHAFKIVVTKLSSARHLDYSVAACDSLIFFSRKIILPSLGWWSRGGKVVLSRAAKV